MTDTELERIGARFHPDLADRIEAAADEHGSKSQVIRAAVYDYLAREDTPDPATDETAGRAYGILVDMVGAGGVVTLEAAKTEIANQLNQPKETIRRDCLKPLARAGAISVVPRIGAVHVVIHET